MEQDDFFKIGFFARTHGLKGEVTMVLGFECPDLATVRSLFIQHDHQFVPHFISSVSSRGSKAFIKLEDVNTADEAERLKGRSVYLPKKERPKLGKGQFYMDEITGFEVVDRIVGALGTVKEIAEAGPARHLVISHNEKDVMIPLNGPFIKKIDKDKRRIDVELPDGFLEL